LIDTLSAQSLRRQNAGDGERHILDPQHLPDGIVVAVNLRRGGAADHADFVCAAHVLRCEWRAVGQQPLTNVEVIG